MNPVVAKKELEAKIIDFVYKKAEKLDWKRGILACEYTHKYPTGSISIIPARDRSGFELRIRDAKGNTKAIVSEPEDTLEIIYKSASAHLMNIENRDSLAVMRTALENLEKVI